MFFNSANSSTLLIGILIIFTINSNCKSKNIDLTNKSSLTSIPGKVTNIDDTNKTKGINDKNVGTGLIIPEESIGKIKLGATREDAIEYFGNPTEEYTYDDSKGNITEIHWSEMDFENRGIHVYLRSNVIFQIQSFTRRFKMANQIAPDDSPNKLRKLFPKLEAFQLENSGMNVDGGKDIIYWVDQKSGIAFGLYNYRKLDKRRIGNIIIFTPGSEFLPGGMVSSPRRWAKRKQWHLD